MPTNLYTARVSATTAGVTSDDGFLSLDVHEPEALGGPGQSTNPEQLMAAALASCLLQSLRIAVGTVGGDMTNVTVDGSVVLTDSDDSGYDATFALTAKLSDIEEAEGVLAQAVSICPFLKVIDSVEVVLG